MSALHAELDFYSAISLKQDSAGRHKKLYKTSILTNYGK